MITVLLPVRNGAPFLGRALRSLARQREVRFEVLAVDDGSTDATPEILRRHGRRLPLRVIRLEPGRGIVGALQAGLAAVETPLVARMDADDVAHPDRLAAQAAALRDAPPLAVVGCRVRTFPRRCSGTGWRRYDAWVNSLLSPADHWRERYVESVLPHPTACFRTAELRAIGGWCDRPWPEDMDLWLRWLEGGGTIFKVPRILHFWRDHPGRAVRRDPRYGRRAFLDLKAWYLARDPWRRDRPYVLWGAGPVGKGLARRLRAHGVAVAAHIEVHPRRVGRRIGGVPVVGPEALPRLRDLPLLLAVGVPGARAWIREHCRCLGLVEGEHFLAVA